MPEQSTGPTLESLFGNKAKSAEQPARQPATAADPPPGEPLPTKPAEVPAPKAPGLTTLTIAAVDSNGQQVPPGAFDADVEEFTGIGWNHIHKVRIGGEQAVKVELLKDRRLVITQVGEV